MGPKLSVSVRKAGVSAMDKFPRTDVFDCRGFYHSPAPEQAVWTIAPARVAKCRTFGGYFSPRIRFRRSDLDIGAQLDHAVHGQVEEVGGGGGIGDHPGED